MTYADVGTIQPSGGPRLAIWLAVLLVFLLQATIMVAKLLTPSMEGDCGVACHFTNWSFLLSTAFAFLYVAIEFLQWRGWIDDLPMTLLLFLFPSVLLTVQAAILVVVLLLLYSSSAFLLQYVRVGTLGIVNLANYVMHVQTAMNAVIFICWQRERIRDRIFVVLYWLGLHKRMRRLGCLPVVLYFTLGGFVFFMPYLLIYEPIRIYALDRVSNGATIVGAGCTAVAVVGLVYSYAMLNTSDATRSVTITNTTSSSGAAVSTITFTKTVETALVLPGVNIDTYAYKV